MTLPHPQLFLSSTVGTGLQIFPLQIRAIIFVWFIYFYLIMSTISCYIFLGAKQTPNLFVRSLLLLLFSLWQPTDLIVGQLWYVAHRSENSLNINHSKFWISVSNPLAPPTCPNLNIKCWKLQQIWRTAHCNGQEAISLQCFSVLRWNLALVITNIT